MAMKNTDFEKKLKQLQLSKKSFVKLVGMPYQTLMNWKQKNETPVWVEPFLFYYEKNLAFDNFLKILNQYKIPKKN